MSIINNKTLSLFDWCLIVGVTVLTIGYAILTGDFDIIGITASISGLICVVLVAKGNMLNYLFGLVNVSLYAYISLKAKVYGDFALNAFYYLPMQFIGWYSWKRHLNKSDETKVQGKRMTTRQRVLLTLLCIVSVTLCGFILSKLHDPQPYKDAATTTLSIIAMFLMVRAYMEQWFIWVINNIISVAMWTILALRGEPHSWLMVIMWVFYLANSVNGIFQWMKLSRE